MSLNLFFFWGVKWHFWAILAHAKKLCFFGPIFSGLKGSFFRLHFFSKFQKSRFFFIAKSKKVDLQNPPWGFQHPGTKKVEPCAYFFEVSKHQGGAIICIIIMEQIWWKPFAHKKAGQRPMFTRSSNTSGSVIFLREGAVLTEGVGCQGQGLRGWFPIHNW